MDHDKLVRIYLKMRKAKSDLTAAYEARKAEIETDMETVENLLHSSLDANKVKSMRTEAGTFYLRKEVKPSCNDWGAYHSWLIKRGDLTGLEKRVMKGFITDYMEQNDGALPPGITTFEEMKVGVRVGNT